LGIPALHREAIRSAVNMSSMFGAPGNRFMDLSRVTEATDEDGSSSKGSGESRLCFDKRLRVPTYSNVLLFFPKSRKISTKTNVHHSHTTNRQKHSKTTSSQLATDHGTKQHLENMNYQIAKFQKRLIRLGYKIPTNTLLSRIYHLYQKILYFKHRMALQSLY
jgi:hypothetical protein